MAKYLKVMLPNPRCRRRRFAALYRSSIWLCEAL
jgi:hypothetical protein